MNNKRHAMGRRRRHRAGAAAGGVCPAGLHPRGGQPARRSRRRLSAGGRARRPGQSLQVMGCTARLRLVRRGAARRAARLGPMRPASTTPTRSSACRWRPTARSSACRSSPSPSAATGPTTTATGPGTASRAGGAAGRRRRRVRAGARRRRRVPGWRPDPCAGLCAASAGLPSAAGAGCQAAAVAPGYPPATGTRVAPGRRARVRQASRPAAGHRAAA